MSSLPADPGTARRGSRPAADASPQTGDPHALTLAADECELVASVAQTYADALTDGRARAYRALAATAAGGHVPGELVPALERVCALSLQTGMARNLGRAEAERTLLAVFRRTPRGRSLLADVEEVNRALEAFAGRRLRSVRATMSLPGRYVLSVETDEVGLHLQVGPEGVAVQRLALG